MFTLPEAPREDSRSRDGATQNLPSAHEECHDYPVAAANFQSQKQKINHSQSSAFQKLFNLSYINALSPTQILSPNLESSLDHWQPQLV